ncbi:hypothetical protein DICTH_0261 [Dictyoglomus thermophilum H-6-12]|uniref:Uncharacterized protein n=1 Tax=Dictyoglomus thermophilum (strain ATCC 35947 / DSM 3960 / H-6-12) TaxID=309799 RepID=B5YC36_DICT6|nr:hypothetical protein DICTH_0261 [Dictyoglomus thermophilum H-6-12]
MLFTIFTQRLDSEELLSKEYVKERIVNFLCYDLYKKKIVKGEYYD